MDEHAVGFMLQQQAVVCDSTGECLGFFEGACVCVLTARMRIVSSKVPGNMLWWENINLPPAPLRSPLDHIPLPLHAEFVRQRYQNRWTLLTSV